MAYLRAEFKTDKTTQEAFKFYLHYYYKKKQFTDIQIDKIFNMLNFLWRRFYSDYENGKLPKELGDVINEENIFEGELVNVYLHLDMLDAFLAMMRAEVPLDRTWKDLQVVLDIFAEFVNFVKNYK